jgi:hypothetical protein
MRTITLCLLLATTALQAQDVGGFLDFRNRFFVFDRGTITELETLPPRAFATGGNYLVYYATNGEVKMFRNGELRTIDRNIATLPVVTDHNFGYVSAGVFRLYDGDTLRALCFNTGGFVVEDSIAGYHDEVNRKIYIHYDGHTDMVEDALLDRPLNGMRTGDNILAWVSRVTKELKVYYRGDVWVLQNLVNSMDFWAGMDMVAYEDPSSLGLKTFYQGKVYDVEAFMPTRLEMGRGLYAYIDPMNALKVFQGGKTHMVQSFAPDEFFVQDSIVVIRDRGELRIFKDGKTTTVLPFFPQMWRASWGTFAWLDVDGTLKSWHDGTITTVLQHEVVKGFTLDRGLITINLVNNKVRVWWKGALYTH